MLSEDIFYHFRLPLWIVVPLDSYHIHTLHIMDTVYQYFSSLVYGV